MSFSAKVKREICRYVEMSSEEALAELSAIMKVSGTLAFSGTGLSFKMTTENPASARLVFTLLKEHFNIQPDHDGAFICQNSWGTSFGQNGYFYISYDDYNIGNHNIVYTQIENNDNYDYIYQTDELGWLGSIGYSEPGAWFANVYTAPERQQLRAVSFYTTDKTSYYKVYAVPEYSGEASLKDRILLGSGYLEQSGYYTVNVDETVYVEGDYAVMVYVWTQDEQHPIAIEYNSTSIDVEVDLSDGQGYISYDGREWQRAEDNYQCNLCLKAFTDGVEQYLILHGIIGREYWL